MHTSQPSPRGSLLADATIQWEVSTDLFQNYLFDQNWTAIASSIVNHINGNVQRIKKSIKIHDLRLNGYVPQKFQPK